MNRNDYQNIITQPRDKNIIFYFGATWCKPCKTVKPIVMSKIENLKNNIIFHDIDVDDNFDVYAYLKKNKVVTGIPTLLLYDQKTTTPIAPKFSCSGTNNLDLFFSNINI